MKTLSRNQLEPKLLGFGYSSCSFKHPVFDWTRVKHVGMKCVPLCLVVFHVALIKSTLHSSSSVCSILILWCAIQPECQWKKFRSFRNRATASVLHRDGFNFRVHPHVCSGSDWKLLFHTWQVGRTLTLTSFIRLLPEHICCTFSFKNLRFSHFRSVEQCQHYSHSGACYSRCR